VVSFTCPNGHHFPRLSEVACEACGSTVVCIPVAALITDEQLFLVEVREARANGYELVCSECGAGIADESDTHAAHCSRYDREEWLRQIGAPREESP
jgi:DNA-directed RNA polymerase subunit RPC12/RpoP